MDISRLYLLKIATELADSAQKAPQGNVLAMAIGHVSMTIFSCVAQIEALATERCAHAYTIKDGKTACADCQNLLDFLKDEEEKPSEE